jgi:glycosyltransferase involved in cell wall biosynthesis
MTSKIDLVVVCENFGVSYSGGSLATCKLLEHMIGHFHQITVLCEQHDQSLANELIIKTYTREQEVLDYLNEPSAPTVLYGDFHKSHYLADNSLPFYFSYHDNWPDMLEFVEDRDQGLETIDRYRHIFEHSKMIFTVSEYKMPFIKGHTEQVQLIRNGITHKATSTRQRDADGYRILMAGNISHRKCHHLPEVLRCLTQEDLAIKIDLYGNVEDAQLYDEIITHSIIQHKGYAKQLNYGDYDLLLHTSMMENLSLSAVDAIANKTPVIAFDVGGLSEVIQDGVNGHLIAPYDTEVMAKCIVDSVSRRRNYRFDKDITQEFNWSASALKMVETIYNTYNQ